MRVRVRNRVLAILVLGLGLVASVSSKPQPHNFVRLATFGVYENGATTPTTAAEILAVSEDGRTLVYTDSESGHLGLVDISSPQHPKPAGLLKVGGEPTSVAVVGSLALVVVARPKHQGHVVVFNLKTRKKVRQIEVGGQPDCISVSPDQKYAAIAVENEGQGGRPALPPGFLAVLDLEGSPEDWSLRKISLQGLATRFPDDPEPEYVDVNAANIAAVTLQENNHIVLVDLPSGKILRHFSAGKAEMKGFDLKEDRHIAFVDNAPPRAREPDAIAWTSKGLATADEGDLDGGSRSFSLFSEQGGVLFSSGNSLGRLAARLGHYPEHRSENLGCEPEGLETGVYGRDELLFVGLERANLVCVYRLGATEPELLQVLPTGAGPEGILALPKHGLLFIAGELDAPDKGIRSGISIFAWQPGPQGYPQISSEVAPWCSLSGLTAAPDDTLYAVADGRLRPPQIFKLRTDTRPARLVASIPVQGNYDLEGIATAAQGGFWAVSEGKKDRPNLLLRVATDGAVVKEIRLPATIEARVRKFGFEGVAELGEDVFVCFQRSWKNEPERQVRIGRYRPKTGKWDFAVYTLDTPGLGLSDLAPWGAGQLAVIERDNRAGHQARSKKIYSFGVSEFPKPLQKKLVRDLLPELKAGGAVVPEKLEGLARDAQGRVWVASDNDGMKNSVGETFFWSF